MTAEKLTRMKADTFRARLRLGLGFAGAVHVPEPLKLRDSTATVLCDALCVDGDLDLAGCTNLQQLPERLIVRGKLILDGCAQLKTLPASVRELFGLSAVGCTMLQSIASIAECHGMVDLAGCQAMEPLPASFRAKGRVTLDHCVLFDDFLTLDQAIPDTLLAALPGRKLGDLFDHRLLARHPVRDAVIRRASHKDTGKIHVRADCSALVRGFGNA